MLDRRINMLLVALLAPRIAHAGPSVTANDCAAGLDARIEVTSELSDPLIDTTLRSGLEQHLNAAGIAVRNRGGEHLVARAHVTADILRTKIPFSKETITEVAGTLSISLIETAREIVIGSSSSPLRGPGVDARDALAAVLPEVLARAVGRAIAGTCRSFAERGRPPETAISSDPSERPAQPGLRLSGKAAIRSLQWALAAAGFDPGVKDGVIGGRTRRAVENAQHSLGLLVTGEPTRDLLDRLSGKATSRTVVTDFDPVAVDLLLEDLAVDLWRPMQSLGARKVVLLARGHRDHDIDTRLVALIDSSLERALTRRKPAQHTMVARQRLLPIILDLESSGAGDPEALEQVKQRLLEQALAEVTIVAEYRKILGGHYVSLVATELSSAALLSSTRQAELPIADDVATDP